MILQQIKEMIHDESKITIINLEDIVSEVNESTITGEKALLIWEEAVKDSFIQYSRRLLNGLNQNDFSVYQIEDLYKTFKMASLINKTTTFKVEKLIEKLRNDVELNITKFRDDKTINYKAVNHLYFETFELFYAKIVKEAFKAQYKLSDQLFLYIEVFRFALLEELSKDVGGVIYNENLYFKEKEIIEKLYINKFESKSIKFETKTHSLEENLLAEETLIYENELDFKKTKVGLSFNHLEELKQLDLSKIDMFYYEPNYFIPGLDSVEEKSEFYLKLKEIIGDKELMVNLFRLDNINYAYGLTDDVLILDEAVKIMPMVYNEIKVIEEYFNNNYAIVIPYTNSKEDYSNIKKMLEHCFALGISFGVGLDIDNAVIDYLNYRKFSFSIVNLDRVIEECFDKSNEEIDKLEPIEIYTIENINYITKKKHKNDYLIGTVLNKNKVLEQVLEMKYSSIILSVNQYKSVFKKNKGSHKN